jgi:hypothetical protein
MLAQWPFDPKVSCQDLIHGGHLVAASALGFAGLLDYRDATVVPAPREGDLPMTLEQLAYVGEIVASVAVVASLIYVGVQVNQNTRAVQAAAVNATTETANAIRLSIYQDPEIARIYQSGLEDVTSLSSLERTQFRLLMHNAVWALWNTYAQVRFSGLARATWEAQEPLIRRFLGTPGGRWFWESFKLEFDPDFSRRVDAVLANGQSATHS